MTFAQYIAILLKRWMLIGACFLCIGAGAFVGSKLMKPLYQSSTVLEVNLSSTSSSADYYSSVTASEQLVQTEATIATSNPVLKAVAAHYSGLSEAVLAQEVTATPTASTLLFSIVVLDPNPDRAANLANDIAATMIQQQQQTTQQMHLQQQQQLQQNLDQMSTQISALTQKIATLQQEGKDQDKGQIASLQAQLSALQARYSQWQSSLAQLELTQAQSTSALSIVQSAQPANSPAQPNRVLITTTGLVSGLFLGLLLALLIEFLDTRVRSPEALTELVKWPVLATIWRSAAGKAEHILPQKGRNPNIESFRILRTNVEFAAIDKPARTLVVTSPFPGDGKSFVATNLAIFMARTGKNTLLIDADLRLPTQQQAFHLAPGTPGLSNALVAFSPRNAAKQLFQTHSLADRERDQAYPALEPFMQTVGVPNLWVMPSGPLPPNSSELLASKAMQSFLAALENSSFEVVIFDTLPLLGLSDASILGGKVDGTLLVVDMNRVKTHDLVKAKNVLQQTSIRVLGCVANRQKRGSSNKAYDYYSREDQNDESWQASSAFAQPGRVADTPTAAVPAFPNTQILANNTSHEFPQRISSVENVNLPHARGKSQR